MQAGDRIWVKGDYANSWPDSIDHVTALPKSFIEMELEFSGEGKAESEEEVLEKYADSPPCACKCIRAVSPDYEN